MFYWGSLEMMSHFFCPCWFQDSPFVLDIQQFNYTVMRVTDTRFLSLRWEVMGRSDELGRGPSEGRSQLQQRAQWKQPEVPEASFLFSCGFSWTFCLILTHLESEAIISKMESQCHCVQTPSLGKWGNIELDHTTLLTLKTNLGHRHKFLKCWKTMLSV